MEKVLLLHGPVEAKGINPITQNIARDSQSRTEISEPFHASHVINAMSYVFRVQGWKVIYSGWEEDAEWLRTRSSYIDHIIISDQNALPSETIFRGVPIQNNKEKLYYGVLRGAQAAQESYGADALVFRLRSDVAVHYAYAMLEMLRLERNPDAVMIEYMDMSKPFSMPDFMNMASARIMTAIYQHLFDRSRAGTPYHISSHVEHSMAYMQLQEDGVISDMLCMGRQLYDSVVWRGVPRYLENVFEGFAKDLYFGGKVDRNPEVRVADLVALMRNEDKGVPV
jgi:hypothetical protein